MRVLVSFTLFFLTMNAFAGLYVEPYYHKSVQVVGQAKEKKNPSGNNDEYEQEGTVEGARLGWAWDNKYMAGFDVSRSKADWELTKPDTVKTTLINNGNSYTDKMKGEHYGLFAGNREKNFSFTLAALWSVYRDTNDNSRIPKGDKLEGYTYAIGAGYAFGRLLKFSLEWRGSTLTRYTDKSENRTYSLPSEGLDKGEYRTQEFYVGISLPLHFGK